MPKCRNCNKPLLANHDRVCPDCGVGWWNHPFMAGGRGVNGACSRILSNSKGNKKLTGYGYRNCGVFCSLRCGFEFGIEKAKVTDANSH